MKFLFSAAIPLFLVSLLAACGGGGDTGSATGAQVNSSEGSWLSFSPDSPEVITREGKSASITLAATASKTFSKAFNVAIIDTAGVVTTDVGIQALSEMRYTATLHTAPGLAVGQHTTRLEVRLCEDDPTECHIPFQGSPWYIPLKVIVNANVDAGTGVKPDVGVIPDVVVKPATNLIPLQVIPQLSAWSTYQGNAAHTGYVAASFNPAAFTWRWSLDGGDMGSVGALASDNGLVFSTRNGNYNSHAELVAISEETGGYAWRVDLGQLSRVNPPAAANGRVYVTSTGHQDTYFWVFDQKTGSLLNKASMASQWENYLAPTVVGDNVYTESGYYGGMSKFSDGGAALAWSINLAQYDGWTPAVDARYAYAYLGGALVAVNVADGSAGFSIADLDNQWTGWTGTPVLLSGAQMAYVANGGRLMGFDLTKHTRAWSQNGTAVGPPTYAKGVVYVLNAGGSVLKAHAADTGALLWVSNPLVGPANETSFNRVILTDNLAFIGSDSSTLAIDLTTHKTVWKYPLGGDLSISNRGVLYILSGGGTITAVNLR